MGRLGPWLLVAAVLGSYAACFRFPGTRDVSGDFLPWIRLVREHGAAGAYAQVGPSSLYPPGSFLLFQMAQFFTGKAFTDLELLKALLVAASLAGAAAYGCWSRRVWAAALMLFATMLSSVILGYLDVLYLAPLLLSLWALQSRRLLLASGCFTVGLLMKWQPIILAPFFVVQAAGLCLPDLRASKATLRALGWLGIGAALPVLLCVLLVDPAVMLRSFASATSSQALSYQGLNPNWIIQLWLYAAQHSQEPRFFNVAVPAWAQLAVRLVFYSSYAFVLGVFALRRRSFEEFLWFACMGFFTYFLFNLGVHENHLYVCMILGLALFGINARGGFRMAAYMVVMANLNLLLFYGIHGVRIMTEGVPRGQGLMALISLPAASVALALINTAFGLACLWHVAGCARTGGPALASGSRSA